MTISPSMSVKRILALVTSSVVRPQHVSAACSAFVIRNIYAGAGSADGFDAGKLHLVGRRQNVTIARNLALMRLRKAESKNLSFDELSHVEDTHDAYQTTENHMVLEKVLHTLTDGERQIVMLHALSGLKHREIADLLGIPQATAISRYNRALAKLRNSMGGDDLDR